MSIYLELFITFFKIGLFTIGGGYAMIPMISNEVIAKGWLSQEFLIDFIAIAESTPGAFAVNIATFVGVEMGGILGGIMAVGGVVLPSLIIIIIIAKVFNNFAEKSLIKNAFMGVRPAVVGLITYAFISIALSSVFHIYSVKDIMSIQLDIVAILIFALIMAISFIKIKNKKLHPIILVFISAVMGIVGYGLINIQ